MGERPVVPADIVDRVGSVCLALPEAYEEDAWVGTRWRIRKRTFAHLYSIEGGWPPVYARATGRTEPVTTVTFRSSGPELEALTAAGHPFYRPQWGSNVVGLILGDAVDWDEVAELLTESYCVLAPKKLVARVGAPVGADQPPT
ncbi:MAG TPA: MmcQ/YjbR family DNA-binding protein [Mycobacteriales bacterium]|jgi:hypothetical protein|nr:MmcQ/YjbR family DNA-binding protein [Mycobacteriales bacterium]